MTYTPAVTSAIEGDEKAFAFLYEVTHQSMYYLALKYMKNADSAEDILQDAYLKAWKALPNLKDPETFPAWLGRIVANCAKNALAKKSPLLFSQTEEGEVLFEEIEDEDIQSQPEANYSVEETGRLVREMIDTLSDEQRLCVLMYYLDGQKIREIAGALEIPENTVKSRLLYGRRALEKKAEELKKKGCDFYGFAPISLLLCLMNSEKAMLPPLSLKAPLPTKEPIPAKAPSAPGKKALEVSGKAAKKAGKVFFKTAAGKAAATALAGVLVCAAGAAILVPKVFPAEPTSSQTLLVSGPSTLTEASPAASATEPISSEAPSQAEAEQFSLSQAFEQVLDSVEQGDPDFGFPELPEGAPIEGYHYFLYDMDSDGVQELIVGAQFTVDAMRYSFWHIYQGERTGDGYTTQKASGSFLSDTIHIPKEAPGLYRHELMRMSGAESIWRVTLENGTVVESKDPELEFTMGDEDAHRFEAENVEIFPLQLQNREPLEFLG